jgi:hypothetical protein
MLVIWNIDSGDTRHLLSPHLFRGAPHGAPYCRTPKKGAHINCLAAKVQGSTLTLLVPWI